MQRKQEMFSFKLMPFKLDLLFRATLLQSFSSTARNPGCKSSPWKITWLKPHFLLRKARQNLLFDGWCSEDSLTLDHVRMIHFASRFTPNQEVDLCGHATLASAHALYETGRVTRGTRIKFTTLRRGDLFAQTSGDEMIELDFPSTAPVATTLSPEEKNNLLMGLALENDVEILWLGRSPFDLVVELSVQAFVGLKALNFLALENLGGRGVIVTCLGRKHLDTPPLPSSSLIDDARFSFLCRFFAPT